MFFATLLRSSARSAPFKTNTALWELHEALTLQQTQHQDTVLFVLEDFNCANLKHTVPNFYLNITCPIRGDGTLDHCYNDSYKWKPCPPFGKSDHASIFLMPRYKEMLKQEALVKWEVAWQTDQTVAALQDIIDDANWTMFRCSSYDVNVFT